MTQNEYEHYRQKLDEQLQSGIELLKAAHAQQIRALELVWTMGRNEEPVRTAALAVPEPPTPPAPAAPPPSPRRSRRGAWDLVNDIETALESVPEVFDRNDVLQALRYEPDRGSLYRALQELTQEGVLAVESPGGGRVTTKYRKTGTSHSLSES
ncbi:MAG TPA: hypothetical protein VHC97_05345 [Thermoanaerobaculia bacterium]|jgi:hypothetical protein|nr:hypothetical protein [Thermoanaerobaculia bacterium]